MQIDTLNIILNITISAGTSSVIIWLFNTYLTENIKNSIKHEYDVRLEYHKSELQNTIDKDLESYKSKIKELESQNLDKWKIKREACFNALNLADAALSNLDWDGDLKNEIIKDEIDTIKVRECYNQLACSCDLPETLTQFKRVLGLLGNVKGDVIVDFRNAIREELNFGKEIDLDRDKAFIARIQGDKKTTTRL
jgi:hypothetical protein